jgi:ribosomal protein S21
LPEVRLQEGEPLESALRRFKRKVQQDEVIREFKRQLVLFEARREAPRKTGSGAQAAPQEGTQGAGLGSTNPGRWITPRPGLFIQQVLESSGSSLNDGFI